jgi:ABC-type nickel/cobalt efflux system permease component RcnA
MGRRLLRAAALATVLAAVPSVVLAHPLGNFTINHYAGITVGAGEIRLDVVIDRAEIPTFQERRHIDTDEDGRVSDPETAAAVGPACDALREGVRLEVDGAAVALAGGASTLTFPGGLGGLPTMRLECVFSAPLALDEDRPTRITFADESDPERVGWREIVVTGDRAVVDAGGAPTSSASKRLTAYPEDLLAQPLDIREVTIVARAAPGAGAATGDPGPGTGSAAVPGGVAGELPALFSSADLTPFVIVASVVLAAVLGAQHALTPGHGKTLMAAYLVGSRGRAAHAVGLGLAVSVSHTIGILLLTAVVVGAQGVLPAEAVVQAAPIVAAVTIVAVGGWMVVAEVRRRRSGRVIQNHDHAPAGHPDEAPHEHDHGHAAEHEHRSEHAHSHEHSHGGVRHSHQPPAGGALSWRGLFALGLAGGLIPSTSALLILLSSIVAGRPAFGFVLVVAFGLGMAAVMTGVGLAVVYGRARIERASASPWLRRLAAAAPLGAAVVVLGVGLVLTAQAVAGGPVL